MEAVISECLTESKKAVDAFGSSEKDNIIALVKLIISSLENGNKLLIFGNGGSAADAQHMAAEFVNRFLIDRRPLAALALTTDTSIITSIGNDFSYDDIFSKQILALGKKGDLAIGISTSGNSPNVVNAIREAASMEIKTAVLTGGSGGKLLNMADICLNVPSNATPHIQEAHLWVEHLLCRLVDEQMFGADGTDKSAVKS
jgi:D-sedoheptulose 7-phosphate isomerase